MSASESELHSADTGLAGFVSQMIGYAVRPRNAIYWYLIDKTYEPTCTWVSTISICRRREPDAVLILRPTPLSDDCGFQHASFSSQESGGGNNSENATWWHTHSLTKSNYYTHIRLILPFCTIVTKWYPNQFLKAVGAIRVSSGHGLSWFCDALCNVFS